MTVSFMVILYYGGWEPNLQSLGGMPVASPFFIDGETNSGEMLCSGHRAGKQQSQDCEGMWGWSVPGVWV